MKMVIQTIASNKTIISTKEVEDVTDNEPEQVKYAVEQAKAMLNDPAFAEAKGRNVRLVKGEQTIWMSYYGI